MSKHTPGPWKKCGGATPHFCSVHSKSGYIVFGMADHQYDKEQGKKIKAPDMWEQQANARLIAAAPELLEALKEAIEFANAANHHIAGQNLPVSEKWIGIVANAEGRS